MHEEKIEGVILRSLEYRDKDRIITAFTPLGLISLIVKGITPRHAALLTLTSPFCEAEFIFKRGRSDLHAFIDGTVIDNHLYLRQKLTFLETAGSLVQTILFSQLTGKSSSELYQLFRLYLTHIPSFESPATLYASFQLKLLTYEGLLSLSVQCNRCKEKKAQFLSKGESLCDAHPLEEGFSFSNEEWSHLLQLQGARRLSALRALALPALLPKKIDVFFKYRIAQQ